MRHNSRASGRPNDGAANLAMLKRTVKKLFSYYPVLAPVTFACILFSAIVSSIPSLFVQNVIQIIQKWYVSRDWASAKAELVPILSLLISLYVLSIIAILVYKQLMAYMTQGFLDKLRQEMFGGMQDLPIRYFDTHQHGDIMSFYTNDIDTLRQLVSEAIPAFIQSGAIVLAVFGIMLYFSIWLTLISVLGVILMIVVTKRVGGGSAKFFLRQQQAVAKTEGYIQETMTGQKVVKVFCHEQRSIEEFDKINDALFEDSYRAHAYASVLGPIIGNIGNFLYVALALVGGVLLLIGVPNLSLSGKALDISILVPFLNMTKQFTGNINQLSQQINSIVMAGAGAQRVFSLIDEKTETDDGFVTLVDANIAPDGTITESDHHTGHWAWKNPNDNGKASYRELRGDVRLIDVDFGYEENKQVLYDVSVYAEPGQKVAFVGATGAGKTTITNAKLSGHVGRALWNNGTLTVNDGRFESNKANVAGAIYNAAGAELTVDGVTFANNSSNNVAGAINNRDGKVIITKSTFKDNSVPTSTGGAINNTSGNNPTPLGTITITGSTFEGNKAGNGGAVWNGSNGKVEIADSTFKGNTALAGIGQGGAITNADQMTITGSTFEGNQAGKIGGAIFNAANGSITFNGTNTFTNNTAAGKANDIHNSGAITVSSGTTTLGSGYSQNEGSLTVNGGAALESLGTMEITGGSVAFKDNSLFAVNGNNLTGNNAAISLSNNASMTVGNTARLRINNAKNGQTYSIVKDTSSAKKTNTVWRTGNIETSSDMLTLHMKDDGTVSTEAKDASEVFTGMDGDTAAIVNGLYGKGLNNTDADQMGVRFLSRATDNRFLGADKNAAAESIESAARIAFAGAAPQMTRMASDAATNAVVNRLGFANPADGAQAMDAEGKIVDRNTTGFALWIAPLWQSQHGWGLDAGNMDYGFNGNLGGVSLGADYTFENAIRAGITFNIGGGYAESSGGDLSSTENRMNFWGLGAYAGWNYENFGVMADVSYTSTWNDLKQDLDSRLGMGNKLEADVQASAISAGLRAEYLLQTSAMDIIPHIGVRYMSLNTWGYDVDTHGGTVLEGDSLHQDIWTFPIGVTFSKDIALDSGWNFKPSLDFTVIPAAGDIKAKHDVHFTGLPGTYEVETQMMDYLTWQGGVGLELANDNMSIGVNYTLQAGQHTTGHGVFGSFRYEF